MRRLYALSNRNAPLSVQNYAQDTDKVSIIRRAQPMSNTVIQDNSKTVVRTTNNTVVENYDTDLRYVETNHVYLNETARCPYIRFPWWVWLLLALGLLALLGLALGLGLGLGLRNSSGTVRCAGTTCKANSQCINNRCECNSGYYYDYTISTCSAYRHVGMTCSTSNTNQQCVVNAYCASNGYCICNTGYFLDQVRTSLLLLLSRHSGF
jgi:hypothetical protein